MSSISSPSSAMRSVQKSLTLYEDMALHHKTSPTMLIKAIFPGLQHFGVTEWAEEGFTLNGCFHGLTELIWHCSNLDSDRVLAVAAYEKLLKITYNWWNAQADKAAKDKFILPLRDITDSKANWRLITEDISARSDIMNEAIKLTDGTDLSQSQLPTESAKKLWNARVVAKNNDMSVK